MLFATQAYHCQARYYLFPATEKSNTQVQAKFNFFLDNTPALL